MGGTLKFRSRHLRVVVTLAVVAVSACRGRGEGGPSVERRVQLLEAAVAAKDTRRAEAATDALEGSAAEGDAALRLAELYVKLDPPEAGARIKHRRERLAARGQLVAAANVGRIEGRWSGWEKNRYLDAL